MTEPRLTALAHGGGCGCKIAPALLQDLLAGAPAAAAFPQLLVGSDTADDAAVWQIDDRHCVVATTDFFMPMVDDPRDFGRIAAANALSDIWAMGGQPIMALAICGMPIDKLAPETIREILQGGASICAEAGIPLAGGHSIDAPEPIYGLVAIGLVSPQNLRRNGGARPGDALILTKGLGVGILSAAIKQGKAAAADIASLVSSATLLNRAGAALGARADVHALTDVTGFGILGHGLEMARASDLRLVIEADALPLLANVEGFAREGLRTGASVRNWAGYGHEVALPEGFPEWRRDILSDPQTSGGLLIACDSAVAGEVCATLRAEGYPLATIIGRAEAGTPGITVI